MSVQTGVQARVAAAPARSVSARLSRIAIYAVLVVFALFYLMPVYVLVVTGLKSFTEVTLDRMWALPEGFSLDSFRDAWLGNEQTAIPGLAKNFWNTILLTVPATLISSVLGSVNGYVLSKWKFRGADVLFPLSLPGFVVVVIWQFTSIWNEFLFAIVLTSNPQVQPIMVALNNLAGSYSVQWNVQMAGALMAALPTLLLYILLGRYFLRGLLAGSLKG